jgi:hypothetical protein
MDTVDTAAESLRESIANFDLYLARRILTDFPTLSPLLRQIRDLAGSVDLDHLRFVPVQSLTMFKSLVDEATACIRDFIIPAFPQEDQVGRGGVLKPYDLIKNSANINSKRGLLEKTHNNCSKLLGRLFPISRPVSAEFRRRSRCMSILRDQKPSRTRTATHGDICRSGIY